MGQLINCYRGLHTFTFASLFIICSPEWSFSPALLKPVFDSSRELEKQKLILPFRLCYCNRSKNCFIPPCFFNMLVYFGSLTGPHIQEVSVGLPREIGWLPFHLGCVRTLAFTALAQP